MNYQSYKIINNSELDYISKGVNAALSKWNNKWCIDEAINVSLNVHTMLDSSEILDACNSTWLVGDIEGKFSVGLNWTSSFLNVLYESLFNAKVTKNNDESVVSPLSQKIINQSMMSLLEILIDEFSNQVLVISPSKADEKQFLSDINKLGSGYILLSICVNKDDFLTIAINSDSIIGSSVDNGKCDVELSSAINNFGNSKVKLWALLGHAELDIKSITDLSVGDVITLDKKLNEELSFYIDNHEVCNGYVGEKNGFLALKIRNSILN